MKVTVHCQLRLFGLAFRLGGFAGDLFGKRGKPLFDGGGVDGFGVEACVVPFG